MTDVFETNEDKAARRQVELEERWAKQVKAAEQADPTKCCALVYGSGRFSSFHGHRCSKPAKFHRSEQLDNFRDSTSPFVTKHYCATHDPVSARARQEKKSAEENADRAARFAREDRIRARQEQVARVVGHLTDAQLVQLEKFLVGTEFAKVQA